MADVIIVALITAVSTVVCQLIIYKSSHRDGDVKRAVRQQEIDDKLKSISDRLDEHNGYAKKFVEVSEALNEVKLDIQAMKKDIEFILRGR